MKKTTIISVMAVLWPFTNKDKRQKTKDKRPKLATYVLIALVLGLSTGQLAAQEPIKALLLGDKIPINIYQQQFPALNIGGKPTDSVQLSSFKGKLLLIDFWAAWCSTCIYKFNAIAELQQKYPAYFEVILVNTKVTKDTPKRMAGILSGQKAPFIKTTLTTIYNDTTLLQLFPHKFLPHYVWIGTNGEVLAITGADMVNEHTIAKFLAGISQKK